MFFYLSLHCVLVKSLTFLFEIMPRSMFSYTKSILERVSFDAKLFCKELEKAMQVLLPYEIEQLREWLLLFTKEKPELRQCLIYIN